MNYRGAKEEEKLKRGARDRQEQKGSAEKQKHERTNMGRRE